VKLGQPATTLSGGEAQRVKLAAHLARGRASACSTSSTSPPPACTAATSASCSPCFERLLEGGGDAARGRALPWTSSSWPDWVIDLGPEGGDEGGHLLFQGTPESLAGRPATGSAAA
jgi:excinuclease ABC subunit A